MSKKITRRVVLGTAIAGLAAGPFVIRALRKNNLHGIVSELNCPVSEGRDNFFTRWKDTHNKFSVKQQTIDAPKTISLKYDFSKQRYLTFRFLETFFNGDIDSPEVAQSNNMMQYTLMEGTIKVNGGKNEKVSVSVDKHEQRHLEIDIEASQKNGAEIVETHVKNPDGTASTIKAVTKSSFSYDSVAQRYKTDIVEKEVSNSLVVGQFVLNQSRYLDLDYDCFSETVSIDPMLAFIARNRIYPQIRFPFPNSPIETGKNFECPLNPQDIIFFELPLYRAVCQGMVECNGFKTVNIVPVYDSSLTQYSKFLLEQYNAFREVLKDQLTDEQNREATQSIMKIVSIKEDRFKHGVPNIKYFVDSEMGCVVRREEYDTSKQYPNAVSAVQRIFQVS